MDRLIVKQLKAVSTRHVSKKLLHVLILMAAMLKKKISSFSSNLIPKRLA